MFKQVSISCGCILVDLVSAFIHKLAKALVSSVWPVYCSLALYCVCSVTAVANPTFPTAAASH